MDSLSQLLAAIKVGEEGYMEMISNSSEYIYSDDPTATGKNVVDLDITDDYKEKVFNGYNEMCIRDSFWTIKEASGRGLQSWFLSACSMPALM